MLAELFAFAGMAIACAIQDSLEVNAAVDSVSPNNVDVKASILSSPSLWGTTRVLKHEDLGRLPVRGIQSYIPLNPGVVEQDGNLHVRGGRSDEIGYMIEGVSTRNVLTGQTLTTVIPEALKELQFHPGVYSARYGFANSGLINQEFRTGDSVFHASLSTETDNFTPQYEKSLGTYSYGYSNYVLTLSGPVIDNRARLFVAMENQFDRDFGVQFIEGFSASNLRNSYSVIDTIVPLLELKPGNMPGQMRNRYTANGALTFDADLLKLRLTGAFTSQRQQGTMLPVENIFNLRRQPVTEASDLFLKLAANYELARNVSLLANVFYRDNRTKTFDPDHGDDYMMYEDSLSNADHGYPSRSMSQPPDPLGLYGFEFNAYGANATRYEKGIQTHIGGTVSTTIDLGVHSITAGGSFEQHRLRYFATDSKVLATIRNNPDIVRSSSLEQVFRLNNNIVDYGYDAYGNQSDAGLDKPRTPTFGSLFMEDEFRFWNLSIGLGLRYDIVDVDISEFIGDPLRDPLTGRVQETAISPVKTTATLNPRIALMFHATNQLGIHANYGKFTQSPPLGMIYTGAGGLDFSGRAFISPGVGDFRPSQTAQYEIGATYELSHLCHFTLLAFLKQATDQFRVSTVSVDGGNGSATYHFPRTDGASRQRGFELTGTIDRLSGFETFASYSFIKSESEPGTIPTSHSHAHRAVISASYLFDALSVPILSNFRVSTLVSIQSGHPFARSRFGVGSLDNPQDAGVSNSDPRQGSSNESVTPSNVTCDLRIDKAISLVGLRVECFMYVQNLFNAKNEINVYRTTGTADDNGFLDNPNWSSTYTNNFGPRYLELYRAINLKNGQAYRRVTGTNLWATPRQIRFGVRVEV